MELMVAIPIVYRVLIPPYFVLHMQTGMFCNDTCISTAGKLKMVPERQPGR